jgi:hypothetical protein
MYKVFSFVMETFLVGYCLYIGVLKTDPTLKDIAFLVAITCINTLINQGKLIRLLKE